MFCPNCGEELSNDSKFCNKCGEKIEGDKHDFEKTKENVKTNNGNNKKIIIILAAIVIILAVITIPFLINSTVQPEIILPEKFTLESTEGGISTYSESEGYDKIDIQKSSIPSKSYKNENIGVLKTVVNNTEYTITIHGKDFHNSYSRDMASIAQKRLMYIYFDEMITKGHLDSSLDDIKFSGDFEGFEVNYN